MPYRKNRADYIVKPDIYKHKKPKSRNPWSKNYDDSPETEGNNYYNPPQDYSQGYVNPYVITPEKPVFDRSSEAENAANLRKLMEENNKPPHLQNRWKQQPSRLEFSQLSDKEKCCCEPQDDFELNENANLPYSKGGLSFDKQDFLMRKERPVWETAPANARQWGEGVKLKTECISMHKQGIGSISFMNEKGDFLFTFTNSWQNVKFNNPKYNKLSLEYIQIQKAVAFLQKVPLSRAYMNVVFDQKVYVKIRLYENYDDKEGSGFENDWNWPSLDSRTVRWNLNRAIVSWTSEKPNEKYPSPPAGGLLHEFIHMWYYYNDYICFSSGEKKQSFDDFTHDQEKEVIDILHTSIAPAFRKLGIKNPPDQVSHKYSLYSVHYVSDVLDVPKL